MIVAAGLFYRNNCQFNKKDYNGSSICINNVEIPFDVNGTNWDLKGTEVGSVVFSSRFKDIY